MALPLLVENDAQVRTGPGWILLGPLSAADPVWAVTGSKLTNALPGYYSAGYTDAGCVITFGTTTLESVKVAEKIKPLRQVATDRSLATIAFDSAGFNEKIFEFALNGGVWTTTGATTTALSIYTPTSDLSLETRCKVIWISADQDEAFIAHRAYQTGNVTRTMGAGATKSGLTGLVFSCEVPPGGTDFNHITAGEWANSPTVTA